MLASLAGPALAPAAAQERGAAREAEGVQPLDRILPGVRRSNPGQFYDAQGPIAGPGGSQHYSLKWMTPDGRIEYLDTDARTGRVLRQTPGGASEQGYSGQENRGGENGRARGR